jgi:hypothetical protein
MTSSTQGSISPISSPTYSNYNKKLSRPPWLPSKSYLEYHLVSANPTIRICDLRNSTGGLGADGATFHSHASVSTNIDILDEILKAYVPPLGDCSVFETNLAKSHLKFDFLQLLRGWCEEGLELVAGEIGSSAVVPSKRRAEESVESLRAVEEMSVAERERDFRCPYHVKDSTQHPECKGKIFPNPRKLK